MENGQYHSHKKRKKLGVKKLFKKKKIGKKNKSIISKVYPEALFSGFTHN